MHVTCQWLELAKSDNWKFVHDAVSWVTTFLIVVWNLFMMNFFSSFHSVFVYFPCYLFPSSPEQRVGQHGPLPLLRVTIMPCLLWGPRGAMQGITCFLECTKPLVWDHSLKLRCFYLKCPKLISIRHQLKTYFHYNGIKCVAPGINIWWRKI